MTNLIVMTASAKMPSSCWGRYGRVAVVETDGVTYPAMISERARGVMNILRTWERRNIGKTEACAFARAIQDAETLAYWTFLSRNYEV